MLSVADYAMPGADLAALTCFFNPTNSDRLKTNYLQFSAGLRRQGVPLYTIEAVFGGSDFWLPDSPYLLRTRAASLCWQKERLLNHLEQYIPEQYTKLAWVDADILFHNPGWASVASEQLEWADITQPFQACTRLDRHGCPELSDVGAAAAYYSCLSGGHTGYAWAWRRDLWRACRLFDAAGSMAGDYLMVNVSLKRPDPGEVQVINSRLWKDWKLNLRQQQRRPVVFVPGSVSHLWHGEIHHRGYGVLAYGLHAARFNPEVDLILDEPSGTWRLARPELEEIFQAYFLARRCDG